MVNCIISEFYLDNAVQKRSLETRIEDFCLAAFPHCCFHLCPHILFQCPSLPLPPCSHCLAWSLHFLSPSWPSSQGLIKPRPFHEASSDDFSLPRALPSLSLPLASPWVTLLYSLVVYESVTFPTRLYIPPEQGLCHRSPVGPPGGS